MSNIASMTCTPRQARGFILDLLQAGLVPYLKGSPGIGKSSIFKAVARDLNWKLIDHRLTTSDPTELSGLPNFDKEGYAHHAPFRELFPLEKTPLPKDAEGKEMNGWLLFFDEFPSASRMVKAASYKVLLDRMIGQHKLHPNVVLGCAGNLATDRAIVDPIGSALVSRMTSLELRVDFQEWLEDVAYPENYDTRIIAFLSQYPEKLMDFDPVVHHEKTFCAPRTWEAVDRFVKVRNGDLTDAHIVPVGGTISSGVALEFIQFIKVWKDLVTVNEVRRDPKTCRVPTDNSLKWAVITHLVEKIDDQNFEDLCTYADRFTTEFRIIFYRMFLARKKELRRHPKFGHFVSQMQKYLGT